MLCQSWATTLSSCPLVYLCICIYSQPCVLPELFGPANTCEATASWRKWDTPLCTHLGLFLLPQRLESLTDVPEPKHLNCCLLNGLPSGPVVIAMSTGMNVLKPLALCFLVPICCRAQDTVGMSECAVVAMVLCVVSPLGRGEQVTHELKICLPQHLAQRLPPGQVCHTMRTILIVIFEPCPHELWSVSVFCSAQQSQGSHGTTANADRLHDIIMAATSCLCHPNVAVTSQVETHLTRSPWARLNALNASTDRDCPGASGDLRLLSWLKSISSGLPKRARSWSAVDS